MATTPENPSSNIVGQGRNDFNLPYRTGAGESPLSLPRSPKSFEVTSPYLIGVIDIRWDNPAEYTEHNGIRIIGVNIYRTFDSPYAVYTKLNNAPVSALYFRDTTKQVDIVGEDALARLDSGANPRTEWVVRTLHRPLVIPGTNGQIAHNVKDVHVLIDNGDGLPQSVVPYKVVGETGEIYLNTNRTYDAQRNKFSDAVLPNTLTGGIWLSYSYIDGLIATNINRKIYYKVTTVALDENTGSPIETPLDEVEARSPYDMEKIDYIWAEGIRRNRWILEQGGERVKLFLRKWNGLQCACTDEKYGYSKRIGIGREQVCQYCYGSGYVGGYEGPYDIIIAPPETEKSVSLTDIALHVTYDWNTWTGPYPLLNDRDVIVRQNNDRFYISRANYQGSRGATYQQHFNLTHIDSVDPVYTLPINGGQLGVPAAWNAYREGQPTQASPTIPVKPEHGPGQVTGRTVTFENIMY